MSAHKGSARNAILERLAKANGRDGAGDGDAGAAAIETRLRNRPAALIPARGQLPPMERIELFLAMAQAADATAVRLAKNADVPGAVADYLKAHNYPPEAAIAPDPVLAALPWADQPMLTLRPGPAQPSDIAGVTGVFGAIAETGTLALRSGPDSPTTLGFLPEAHIALVWAEQVSASLEDVWTALRREQGEGVMPRTVNLITGPSRSADIEQTLQLGAHGPKNLHILLIDDERPKK
jgi:L-lactate dehydrogenase complex protein LldG